MSDRPVVAVRHVPHALPVPADLPAEEEWDQMLFETYLESRGVFNDTSRYATNLFCALEEEFYRAFFRRRAWYARPGAAFVVPAPLGLWNWMEPVQEPVRRYRPKRPSGYPRSQARLRAWVASLQ